MLYRQATINDIPRIQVVRNAVKENTLSDPGLVTNDDCVDYIENRGRGWVCEVEGEIVGFSIVDLVDNNIWALFLLPEVEGRGIGRELHRLMLDWYFDQTQATVWLGTSPGTRAEAFYHKAGWKRAGMHGANEVKFEMTYADWLQAKEAM